jgi:hypothetical protein
MDTLELKSVRRLVVVGKIAETILVTGFLLLMLRDFVSFGLEYRCVLLAAEARLCNSVVVQLIEPGMERLICLAMVAPWNLEYCGTSETAMNDGTVMNDA